MSLDEDTGASEPRPVDLEIYKRHSEYSRWQDELFWSRLKTIYLLESALLVAIFKGNIGLFWESAAAVLLLALVLILSIITWKDSFDRKWHLRIVADFECKHGWPA